MLNLKASIRLALGGLVLLSACGPDQKAAKDNQTKSGENQARPVSAPQTVSQVVGLARIEPEASIVALAAGAGGIITRIRQPEGAQVDSGQVILELDHAIEEARVTQVRSRLATQHAQVRADEAALEEARIRLGNAQKRLARTQTLYNQHAETAQALDDVQTDANTQSAQVRRLEAVLTMSQARVRETVAELRTAERERDLKFVKAPSKGRILKIDVAAGEAVAAQAAFADFGPEGRTVAVCEVDELFSGQVREGQPAVIRQTGTDQILARGHVGYTAPFLKRKSLFSEQAGDLEDRRVREVKIVLEGDHQLLFNSRVECLIDTRVLTTASR